MKSRGLMLVLMLLTFLTVGCYDNNNEINPEIHIITSMTLTITNRNSWDWENVSIILNPGKVETSNFPKHGQYVMQYQGFLWETPRIKAKQKVIVNISSFVDGKGKCLAPGSLPSAIEIDTFQAKKNENISYVGNFHQDQ